MSDLIPAGWLTTEEAQALTGYAVEHLRRLARAGQVTGRKIGGGSGVWLYDAASLREHRATARPGRPRRSLQPT